MKSIEQILIIFLFGLTLFSCSKENNTKKDENTLVDDSIPTVNIQMPIFDSLKGNWTWYSTYTAKRGTIKNDYKYAVKFIAINADSTIEFETCKDDSIKAKTNLKISRENWGRFFEPKIILQHTVENRQYFRFVTIDTIELFENCNDCSVYYFSKN
jgi:hypothetical protein